MIGEYGTDREFADRYLSNQRDIIEPILGRYSMRIGDFHNDTKMVGDLTVLRSPRWNIGLRVRRSQFAARYGLKEFTLRSDRTNGVETELAKILRGLGGWFAYFHSDEKNDLPHWMIIDLQGFRKLNVRPRKNVKNKDGTTSFCIYNLEDFSVGVLIAASESVLGELTSQHRFAVRRRQFGEWEPFQTEKSNG